MLAETEVTCGLVGRYVETGGLDQRFGRRSFVAGKVVENDDVTRFQGRDKHLADIGLEPRAINRPIDDQRRNRSGVAQTGDQRRRLAMTVRDCQPQPLSFWCIVRVCAPYWSRSMFHR